MINICEIKYSAGKYAITKDEAEKIANRLEQFRSETGTKKGIYVTLITSNGLADNMWKNTANSEVTLSDLMR